jgi:hypothetical protein
VAWVHRFALQIRRHVRPPSSSSVLMQQQVVALRIELSVTAVSGPSGRPVLDYRTALRNDARTRSAVGMGSQLAVSATSRISSNASASSSGAVRNKGTQPKKKARRLSDTGPFFDEPVAHPRVGPSVIFACFYCFRARNLAVHSPLGQMSRTTAAPSAISV